MSRRGLSLLARPGLAALLTALLAFADCTAGAIAPAFAAAGPTPPTSAAAPNPIQIENAKPGTPGWDLPGGTATRIPTPTTSVEGYTSQISLAPGDVLQLHVSTTPAAHYRVEIYRLGWYQGTGGRRLACLPSCTGSEAGQTQPVPSPDPSTGLLDAGWRITDSIPVGPDWTSGYFVAKLFITSGPSSGEASWVPFIVRAAPGAGSAILVQASANTWEAYNGWGGKSLYGFNSTSSIVPASGTNAAAMVSFNRPFANAIDVFQYEYDRVRWLERNGYDVSYQTDIDTDENPASLLGHRLDVVSGHDEYWSGAMRNAWEAARAAGVNLAFLGGNIGYWQARYASGDHTLIEYRSAKLDPDPVPSEKTVQFSAPPVNRPECQLLGVGYPGGATKPQDPPRSYAVTPALVASPWASGTGLQAGQTIYDSVGYEWDNVQSGCAVPPLTVLLHFAGLHGVAGSPAGADAVTYTAPSGARVVSDGSLQMAWVLDDFGHTPHANPGIQQLFANIFDSLGAPPGSAPPGVLTLLTPTAGTLTHDPVRFTWSAGGGLPTYVLSVDGRPVDTVSATGCDAARCSVALSVGPGKHTWSLAATDDMGNSSASGPIPFRVDDTPPSPFAVRLPRSASVLWNPSPRVCWTASRDVGAGLAGYVVIVDGRVRGQTARRCLNLHTPLSEGRHRVSVEAVDRAGNRRSTPARRFTVRSVRVVRRSSRSITVRVFCAQRCTLSVVTSRGTRIRRHGASGRNTITVALAPGRATVTVRVRIGRAQRTVRLRVPR